MRRSRVSIYGVLATGALLMACSAPPAPKNLGSFGGGKADFVVTEEIVEIEGRYVDDHNTRSFTITGSGAFKVTLTQPGIAGSDRAYARLRVDDGEYYDETSTRQLPVIEWEAEDTETHTYTVTVINRSRFNTYYGLLRIEGIGNTPVTETLLADETRSHKVLFTNPVCAGKLYDEPILMSGGSGYRMGKPANVWCRSSDKAASGQRASSPQHQLVEWITPTQAGDEIFLAYLSYSDSTVHNALCEAAQRGVKLTFVYAGGSSKQSSLEACGDVTFVIRGKTPGVGYAHNKIFMVNAMEASANDVGEDRNYQKIAFSSGNMSSGVVIHHENWQFLDVARESYFAAAHRCLAQLQGDDSGTPDDTSDDPAYNGSEYTEKMAQCLTTAEANFPKESDIEIFFMPNETHHFRLRKLVVDGIKNAAEVDIAAHRFGSAYSEFNGTPDDETDDVESDGFISDLANRLAASDNPVQMRMVGDDDIYWLKPYGGDYSDGDEVGSNMAFERKNVDRLHRAGGDGERFEIRYLETNHGEHRLHHNKWLIFRGMADKPDAMLCGAANLTGTGFGDPESNYAPNFENIYWIRIPAVVQQYTEQMNRFWGVPGMGDTQDPPAATRPEEMPETDE